jgi:hypothetical protein
MCFLKRATLAVAQKWSAHAHVKIILCAGNCILGVAVVELYQLPSTTKILVISDNHIKGLSSKLRGRLVESNVMLGIVKPNARANELTATARQEVNKLTQKDIFVCWGIVRLRLKATEVFFFFYPSQVAF